MSTKNILTEWRNFLNEAGEFEDDFMPAADVSDMSAPELEYEPLDRDHSEDVKEIESFLTTDLRCDVSSEEYASFISCLSRRENADTVAKLVELVRDCVSGF